VTVALKKVHDDVTAAVSLVMEEARFKDFIPPASTVFLKVNLGWDLFIPGSVTNPAVFEGVVRTLQGYAREMFVVESDQVLENIERAYRRSRISEIARRLGVPWLNLSRGARVTIHRPDNRVIQDVAIPEVLTRGVIVTLPVMKTHGKTVITASLKNQWGCIPKMRHMYHLCLDEAISDVNAVLNVRFSVVDGTIAMDGNGPKTGRPRELGIVGAGGDLVEVDSVCARLMGFDPREIPHLVEAERRGLGKIGTSHVGDVIEPPEPFRPAGHNLVSKVELFLRRSRLKKVVFETPIFLAMVGGAKIYYYFFDFFKGRALRKKFRAHPVYGRYFEKPGA